MSFSSSFCEDSPEPGMSGLCVKLETQFTDDLSKAEAMRVYARVRPMLRSEEESGYKECITAVDEQTVRAVVPSSSVRYKSNSNLGQGIIEDFRFTSAYGPEVGQFVFFEETMMNTMQNFIEGQNSLVFSYGITGSGKTFTLQGNPNNPGIIPLSLHLFFASIENQLLNKIVVKPDKFDDVKILNDNEAKREHQLLEQLMTAHNQEEWNFRNSSSKSLAMVLCETFSDKFVSDGLETTLGVEEMAQAQAAALMKELGKKSAEQQSGCCSVWVSFAEIYNEYVYDLLQPNVNQRTKLLLGEDKNGDVYVKGLTEVCVFNSFEALNILNFGQKNLKIASTKLNYQSSRSHCIFTIKVIRIPDPENISYAKVSRLSFCDLAGSERAAKSQTTGVRLKEAGCINTSLLVLGRCLEQLRVNPSPRDRKRIPFRESKLTRLFSGFFTGKGKAVMITNASPSEVTFDETLHALRFSAVATELIINDSYIATASNTLQTITNIWTNARANVSTSSDKSISFEDSTLEALQEKDELIEKLVDLADSLTKNLEIAKKEKAELEIKIRREVCLEYSEYSDELLERQRKIYEEEKESIREIYKKRITAMEKMYENIIQDESDGSDSSGEEEYEDAKTEVDVIKRHKRKSNKTHETAKDIIETSSKDKLMVEGYIQDIEALKADLLNIAAELESTKEELEKSKDYCTALETATEEMERTLEISSDNLKKALSENGELKIKVDYLQASQQDGLKEETEISGASGDESLESKYDDIKVLLENTLNSNKMLKKEIDALKIDCVSYKCDNDDLFKKKNVLEEQLNSMSKEIESTKVEREDLYQKLAESEQKIASLSDEIKVSENKINELVESHKESKENLENSLAKTKDELKNLEEAFKSLNEDYDRLVLNSAEKKRTLDALEVECASVKEEMAQVVKENVALEEKYVSVYDEFNSIKNERECLHRKLTDSEEKVDNLRDEVEVLEKKVKELVQSQAASKEGYEISLKNAKDELAKAEEELNSVNQAYEEALLNIENEKQKLNALETECASVKEEMAQIMKEKEVLEGKNASLSEELKCEELASKKELESILVKLSEASVQLEEQKKKAEDLRNLLVSYEIDIAELQKENKELKDKIKAKTESEELACKEKLETAVSELAKASSALDKEKKKMESMTSVIISYEKEMDDLRRLYEESQQSVNSQNEPEVLSHKEELEIATKKLSDALSELCEEKKKADTLRNAIVSYENEVAELKKLNFELSENESKALECQKELENVNDKLIEALSALEAQKKEMENLANTTDADKLKIAELQKQNFELQQKINAEIESQTLECKKEQENVNDKLIEDLASTTDADKLEISELLIEIESQTLQCKKEQENVNNKLIEALSTLETQKKEIENLANTIHADKLEIAELQKQNFELQQKINAEIESKALECQKEVENVNNKLIEALSAMDAQKKEMENLASTISADKLEIAELQKQNFELQQKINAEIDSKADNFQQEIDPVSEKLNEILRTVEFEKMQNENESAKNKIIDLLKIEEELKKEMSSKNLHADTLCELLLVLEKCELHATKKIDLVMLDSAKLSETIQTLETQLKENKDQYEIECNVLKDMISLLQKCELFASNKTKELHKSSITHVEQIMDFEKCIKQRDASIEGLKNDNNLLQKQLKNLQDSSKKQLQTQKQQLTIEISNMKSEKSALEKGNKDLKDQVTKLTAVNGKLQSEIENIKTKLDEVIENKNMVQKEDKSSTNDAEELISEEKAGKRLRTKNKKNYSESPVEDKLNERRALRKKGKTTVEEKSEVKPAKKNERRKVQMENQSPEVKQAEREKTEVEKKSPEVKPVKKSERRKAQVVKKSPELKSVKDDKVIEENCNKEDAEKKKETGLAEKPPKVPTKANDQDEKKKNKSKKKVDDKKSKTTIYEETDENINIENTPKVKSMSGRQLKSVENVTPLLNLANNKDLTLSRAKGLKRKGLNDSFENILKEKNSLKKLKSEDIENNMNLKKPQNLRIQLLKAANTANDIPMPSPRITRGRKRLCNLSVKENTLQTKRNLKTVRS